MSIEKYKLDKPPDWLIYQARKMTSDITGLPISSDWKSLLDAAEGKSKELQSRHYKTKRDKADGSCLDISIGVLRYMMNQELDQVIYTTSATG